MKTLQNQPRRPERPFLRVAALAFLSLCFAPFAMAGSGEELFAQLEQRLLEASNATIGAVIRAEGAIEVRVAGEVQVIKDKQLRFGFRGDFMSEQWEAELFSNDTDTRWRNRTGFFTSERGAELEESILLGFTRMGLLHNIARIGAGDAPDHADGGVAEWVKAVNFGDVVDEDLRGREMRRIDFEIVVEGEESGSVVLWLDAETGLPARREQTVQFAEGEMKVVEIYRNVVLNAKVITESEAFKTEY